MGKPGTYVRAYHLILTAYGFWLPNDPRGSWSDFVRSFELVRFGRATKTAERRSLARDPSDHRIRRAAKQALVRDPAVFDGLQARAVARGLGASVARSGFVIHACAVMPDHVHLVVARHRYSIERVAMQLKSNASRELVAEGLHPFQHVLYADGTRPMPWARKHWSVFLSDDEGIDRAIRYVNNNPVRDGKKAQAWTFVIPFV